MAINNNGIKQAEKTAWRLSLKNYKHQRFGTKALTPLQRKAYVTADEIVSAVSYALYKLRNIHDTAFPSQWADIKVSINAPYYIVQVDSESITFTKCDLRFFK